ncbi:PPE family protein [Mycobacterium xenopi 3993]|nr:PPE family protein [Mycobacterium xenopi 3993]
MNTIPIAVNEFQYFVELWNRAAGAMDEYASATAVNTTFPPFPVAPPIMAMPGRPRRGWPRCWPKPRPPCPTALLATHCWSRCPAKVRSKDPKGRRSWPRKWAASPAT